MSSNTHRSSAVLVMLCMLLGFTPMQLAASSWSPTLLVNTEAFQVIDAGDGSSNIEFRFGDNVNRRLYFDTGASRFVFTNPLLIQGNLTATGSLSVKKSISGAVLRIDGNSDVWGSLSATGSIKTKSGAIVNADNDTNDAILQFGNQTLPQTIKFLHASQRFQISSNVSVLGNLSGASLNVNNLRSCNTIDTDSAGFFTCGTDEQGSGGGTFGTGNVITIVSGTALTSSTGSLKVNFGSQFVQSSTGSLRTSLYTAGQGLTKNGGVFTLNTTVSGSLAKFTTHSGSAVYAKDAISSSGTLTVKSSLRVQSGAIINADNDTNDAVLQFGNQTLPQTLKFFHASQRFQFSTNVSVLGNLSGATINVNNLRSCDTIDTDSSGRMSCGTDAGGAGGGISLSDADGRYVNQSGDGMTGSLLIKSGNPKETADTGLMLEVAGAASGKIIHAQDRLASSGVLVLRPAATTKPTLYVNGTQKVGIMTNNPHSTLTSSGSFATTYRIATATGNILATDHVVLGSGSSPITLTLPSAVGINGRQYTIKKIDTKVANLVHIATTSSQTIDGVLTWQLYNRGQKVTVVSDGANWRVVEETTYGVNGFRTKGTAMNQWYTSPNAATALANTALTATASARVMPFIAEKVTTIDAMAVSVVTTAASSNVRLGIYMDNGNNYPGKLIVDAGTVATTAAGAATLCPSGCTAASATLPVTIQPGLYWLAVHHTATAITIRGFAVASVIPILGYGSTLPAAPNMAYIFTTAQAALPTFFYPGATLVTAVPLPAIFVRSLY